jgi:hypothetical protein
MAHRSRGSSPCGLGGLQRKAHAASLTSTGRGNGEWPCSRAPSPQGRGLDLSSDSWRTALRVGCPRNNKKKFSVWTKTNRSSICFRRFSVCFAEPKTFFWFVSVFRTSIETNRILSKQTETNQKNLKKKFSIRGSSKPWIFFSRLEPKQTETNWNSICFGCFSV